MGCVIPPGGVVYRWSRGHRLVASSAWLFGCRPQQEVPESSDRNLGIVHG